MRPNLFRDSGYGVVLRILGQQAEEGMGKKGVTGGPSRGLGGTQSGERGQPALRGPLSPCPDDLASLLTDFPAFSPIHPLPRS